MFRHIALLAGLATLPFSSTLADTATARIVGGDPAPVDRWPWMAQLAVDDPSVSGYLHSFGFLSFDADGSPFDLINDTQTSKTDQVTQEFRISSPSDDRFTWIAGASFFYQNQWKKLLWN